MLTGEKIGRLELMRELERAFLNHRFRRMGEFKCDCGKIIERRIDRVEANPTSHCGCSKPVPVRPKAPPTILPGERFGGLTFVHLESRTDRGYYFGLFSCVCGAEKALNIASVRKGETKSCGCASASMRAAAHTVHGEARHGQRTAEYRVWKQMRRRCNDPRAPRYARYGGRGISVCERWKEYEAFLTDMGRKPSADHTLDRINSDGNYEPENCRWATPDLQSMNRAYTWKVVVDGQTMTVPKAAASRGLKYHTVRARLLAGKTIEQALQEVVL